MIAISPEVGGRFDLHIAYSKVSGVTVRSLREEEKGEFLREVEALRKAHTVESLRSNEVVRLYRDFYWRLGIDPTKTRPSSEAFLRRVLRRGFIHINNVVDAGNLASIKTLVPIGLYDLDLLKPPICVRFTSGGERFVEIGGRVRALPPGMLVMTDGGGRVIHIYPHRDSGETAIRDSTKDVLVVALGAPGLGRERVLWAADLAAQLIAKYSGGRVGRAILAPPPGHTSC